MDTYFSILSGNREVTGVEGECAKNEAIAKFADKKPWDDVFQRASIRVLSGGADPKMRQLFT